MYLGKSNHSALNNKTPDLFLIVIFADDKLKDIGKHQNVKCFVCFVLKINDL